MNEWPFNGKSAWSTLSPGQKFAAFVGVPIFHLMFRSALYLVDTSIPWLWLRILFAFSLFFILPWVYVNGIGTLIAIGFEIVLKATRRK